MILLNAFMFSLVLLSLHPNVIIESLLKFLKLLSVRLLRR